MDWIERMVISGDRMIQLMRSVDYDKYSSSFRVEHNKHIAIIAKGNKELLDMLPKEHRDRIQNKLKYLY